MSLQTLISTTGPFPQETTFTSQNDDEVILVLSGSVYSNAANQLAGVQVVINGQLRADVQPLRRADEQILGHRQ